MTETITNKQKNIQSFKKICVLLEIVIKLLNYGFLVVNDTHTHTHTHTHTQNAVVWE